MIGGLSALTGLLLYSRHRVALSDVSGLWSRSLFEQLFPMDGKVSSGPDARRQSGHGLFSARNPRVGLKNRAMSLICSLPVDAGGYTTLREGYE
jgi:hypothetical protein